MAEVGLTFSWRDLLVMVRALQRRHDTATARAIHGEHWSTGDQILAGIFDLLANANWQRAGKKHAPRPKPLQRPWEKRAGRQIGSKPIPISQFDDWWESKRKQRR